MSTPEPETVNVRHTLSGALQRVTPEQYELFSDYLELVPDDAKPYAPGMFKPGKVGEFAPKGDPIAETEAIADAQSVYDNLLAEGYAPNSRVVRKAKAALDAAIAEADAEVEEAKAAIAETTAGTEPATSAEGDAQ